MLNQSDLLNTVAAYKKDSQDHFWEAVVTLLSLAWPYRKEGFVFDESFPMYDHALVVCIEMSDACIASAKERLSEAIEELEWDEDPWPEAFSVETEERFDMAGTHLLDLLAIWISVAAVNGWTKSYTRVMVSRYLANPFLCPYWKDVPKDALAWGRGYAKDIVEQLTLIGQGIILSGARYAEQEDEKANGATYYIRRRGSTYDCTDCEEMANIPIPIEVPFVIPHPRCVCFPEYHNEPIPE